MGAPRPHPADLVTGQARAEHRVAHERLRGAVGDDVVLDPQIAHDLDGPLVGDVRPRRVRRPPVLGDHDVLDTMARQEKRGRSTGRAAADHQDVRGEHLHLHKYENSRAIRPIFIRGQCYTLRIWICGTSSAL
jgi:hypothetical protein